jgi:hypothetical protein
MIYSFKFQKLYTPINVLFDEIVFVIIRQSKKSVIKLRRKNILSPLEENLSIYYFKNLYH